MLFAHSHSSQALASNSMWSYASQCHRFSRAGLSQMSPVLIYTKGHQPCSLAAGTPGTLQKLVRGISCSASSSTLTITRPDDWHLHLRDGAGLKSVVPHTAQHFSRAVIMPNLVPPVTSSKQVYTCKQRQCSVTLHSAACRKSREAEALDNLMTGQQVDLESCADTSHTQCFRRWNTSSASLKPRQARQTSSP